MRPTPLETSERIRRPGVSVPEVLLILAIFVAGCSGKGSVSGGAPRYSGTFEAICSPVDASGILFDLYRLSDPKPPQVSLTMWQFELGSQIELGERGGFGAAFLGGTEWIPATDGAMGLENYVEGEIASGWFWLELDGVDRIEGQFEATWSDAGPAICG